MITIAEPMVTIAKPVVTIALLIISDARYTKQYYSFILIYKATDNVVKF